jgi:hypothetical protein
MGLDNIKLKSWKTKRTFIDEEGNVYVRKEIEGSIRWYKCDFVDIPIIDPRTSNSLEDEFNRISAKYSNSHADKTSG